ncbi:hypothetical protein PABG_07190 [Paracoccidioides brasiliensis Pb03]|nr:hypothetical protein PABG_07190 [Paracoccidioides brasiliensis Pb03]
MLAGVKSEMTTTIKNGLHILDAFCRKGFMSGIGAIFGGLHRMNNPDDTEKEEGDMPKLRFLEISYTYRGHSDKDFLSHIPGDELPAMLGPFVMAVSFNLNAPPSVNPATGDNGDLPHDPAEKDEEEGNPIPGKKTEVLDRKLTGGEVGWTSRGDNRAEDEQELSFSPESGPGPSCPETAGINTIYTLDTDQ